MTTLTAKFLIDVTHPGRYSDDASTGLHFVVSDSGGKSWILRYQINGRRRDAGLGAYPETGLKAARQRAVEMRALIDKGIDPIEAKRAQEAITEAENKDRVTFREDALRFIEQSKPGWSDKHAEQWLASLEDYVFPAIGAKPVSQISTEDILGILNPIWHTKGPTARRVRNRIERVLDYSRFHGHRKGENPARWAGHLSTVLSRTVPTVTPLDAMPYQDLPTFMWRLESEEGTYPRAMEIAILTACRTSEVLGAKWGEIDFENAVWNIPAERMKNRKPHRVPLARQLVELLKALRSYKGSDADSYLFPNRARTGSLPPNALRRVLIKLQVPYTVHGFRATFRTWAAEQTDYPGDVCEMALAHTLGSKVEQAYKRGDLLEKRRPLMQDWADHVLGRLTA